MTCALPASCAKVPEVSTSMYTAWVWLRGSLQAARPTIRSNARDLSMGPPSAHLVGRIVEVDRASTRVHCRLRQVLDEQRQHDRHVIQRDQDAGEAADD